MSVSSSLQDMQSPGFSGESSDALRCDAYQFPAHGELPRVVSVSAHVHDLKLVRPVTEAGQDCVTTAESVAHELQSLVKSAASLADELRQIQNESRGGESDAARTIVHLQDRLRLGAQMIKAFQTQIGRIEASVAELKAQERRVEAAEARTMQRIAQVQGQIETALQSLRERAEEVFRQTPCVERRGGDVSESASVDRIAWK